MFPDHQLLPDLACSGKMRNFSSGLLPLQPKRVNPPPLHTGVATVEQPDLASDF